jgi:hypothetical protein
MGRNSKHNKAITKMYLPQLKKYCEQLEAQLEQVKTDPNTALGQVINQARELYTQNSRLSVLCAALIDKLGEKVSVKKSAMDKFENHRILIKWELPEGVEKPEEAEEFVFMYEATKNEQQPQVQVGPAPHTTETPEGGELVTPVVTEASVTGTDALKGDYPDEAIAGTVEEVGVEELPDEHCPYCEDANEHAHTLEEIEELQADPTPECDPLSRVRALAMATPPKTEE